MKSAIVLCGGLSTRMGRDKGSMTYEDKPMIIHVLESLRNIADEILVILRDEEQCNKYMKILVDYEFLDVPGFKLLTDIKIDQGPLGGILTGLKKINSNMAMIVPCDSPLISDLFISRMFEISEENKSYEAFVPIWPDGNLEPLHSVYPKNSCKIIEKLLADDIKNVKTLISSLNVKYVEIDRLGLSKKSFLNFNSLEDIRRIEEDLHHGNRFK